MDDKTPITVFETFDGLVDRCGVVKAPKAVGVDCFDVRTRFVPSTVMPRNLEKAAIWKPAHDRTLTFLPACLLCTERGNA